MPGWQPSNVSTRREAALLTSSEANPCYWPPWKESVGRGEGAWAVCAAAARLQKWLPPAARSLGGQHRGWPGESFSIAAPLLFFLSFSFSSFLWWERGRDGGLAQEESYFTQVWGLIHLCCFKNKMSVQLWDLKSLNISKHRESWIFFSSMLTHPCDRF